MNCSNCQSILTFDSIFCPKCGAPVSIQPTSAALDFSFYITDRTRDSTGREWVFTVIDRWTANPEGPSSFVISGEPGIGESAIAARLTQLRNLAAYHFRIARQIATTAPLTFVRSLSLQLADHCQPFTQALARVGHTQINVVKVSQTVAQAESGARSKASPFRTSFSETQEPRKPSYERFSRHLRRSLETLTCRDEIT